MEVITIEGRTYALESLSPTAHRLIGIHHIWNEELDKARMETAKLEAALRDLTREIVERVQNDGTPQYVEEKIKVPTTKKTVRRPPTTSRGPG